MAQENFRRIERVIKGAGVSHFNDIKKMEFATANVQLNTGEWVNKDTFDALSKDDQQLLKQSGTKGYIAAKQATFEAANVKLSTGEWLSKDDYNKLSDEDKQKVNTAKKTTIKDKVLQQYGFKYKPVKSKPVPKF